MRLVFFPSQVAGNGRTFVRIPPGWTPFAPGALADGTPGIWCYASDESASE